MLAKSKSIATVNPTTGQILKVFEPLSDTELEHRLKLSEQAFKQFQHTTFAQRAECLYRAAKVLEQDQQRFAELMTLEMGKTLVSAVAEIAKCAHVCRYYAENAERFLADVPVESDAGYSFIRYQPLGPILAVMPWNFPFWQVFRFAAPALMAGNVGLLKHASNVPQCALAIEEIFERAGFEPGVFQTLLVGSDRTAAVVADARVRAVTLTGSEPAGAAVAAIAGRHLKKIVLELGGSDPFIVLRSADLESAVSTAVKSRMLNNGQSCIAAKRFIVVESVADVFERRLVEQFEALRVGDPMDSNTDLGPLATPEILTILERQVQMSLKQGARLLTGGHPLRENVPGGNFYAPTILTDIPLESPAYREELFGPVAVLFRVADLDAAIQLANDTPFGLGASAWTTDAMERDRVVDELECGAVFINGMVKSDPRLPFGGTKRSGYGRELSSHGLLEFVNIKTVWTR